MVVGMMKDETAGAEIGEFAGQRSKCYALCIERPDMKIDFNNAESTYTRATCEQSLQGRMPGQALLSTLVVCYEALSKIPESGSTVVCEEVKKDKGIKRNVIAKDLMLEDYKDVLFTGIPQYR
jgi:hypothetical protein